MLKAPIVLWEYLLHLLLMVMEPKIRGHRVTFPTTLYSDDVYTSFASWVWTSLGNVTSKKEPKYADVFARIC